VPRKNLGRLGSLGIVLGSGKTRKPRNRTREPRKTRKPRNRTRKPRKPRKTRKTR